ncbi:MAG: hypothetical protein UW68_C0002G0005 [Candidatus Collierbacteria bacterium GW2011_GWB1_44_6]|uniref:Uncharacterized protein n=2 Tax=Candidatus Collieribacteriota TaxID=1752725 RepID=A0A0G1JQC0_9BACT|nr:MAG: hypothetical protein UV68_C0012G0011 [Candidatus Collierbacteria bacterium GW2011_GWC2_43_12]KKT73736.1 MAG: hypothetical protein UW68_C0002G0005 [Candidatus Collierbacteria bacterium GW2011_GWB1_44_6]KKT83389.1 MAG: hypothetical protein UW80_C0015G0009 [Microgenomates group bacterium GW2011_GWC1_44_9]
MKTKYLPLLLVFLIGAVYLSLPTPTLPDLRDSARSDEEGDTWQNPDQKGFYSDLTRSEVLSDIQSKSQIKFLGLTLPTYRLNYPPEDAFTLVRDQTKSNYLEEIVYPMRNSTFVNGWEPEKAPQNANLTPDEIPDISLHGVAYQAKITLRPVNSPVWARLIIWTLIFPSAYLVSLAFKNA